MGARNWSHQIGQQVPLPTKPPHQLLKVFFEMFLFSLGFWIMGWCRIKHSQTSRLVTTLPRFWKSSSDWKRSCGCGQWSRWRWIRGSYTSFRQRPSNNRYSPASRGEKYQLTTHAHKNCLCKNATMRSWVSAFFFLLWFLELLASTEIRR